MAISPSPISVITGGAGALGAETALHFAEAGDHVILIDNDSDGVDAQAERITNFTGSRVSVDVVDLTDPAAASESIRAIADEYGRLDRLINNAAFNPKESLERTTIDAWDKAMALNMRTPMILAQAAMPLWKATRSGRVVNIASRTYLSGGPTAYASSKAGVVGLTRSMALELGPLGVTANAVAPSMIVTPFTRVGRSDDEFADFVANHQRLSALGRLATVDDIVPAIAFLASENAKFITGEVLHVAGGAQLAPAP